MTLFEVKFHLSEQRVKKTTFLFISLQFLKSSTMATWGALFRHEALSKDAAVVKMAVKFLRASMTNLVKVRSW